MESDRIENRLATRIVATTILLIGSGCSAVPRAPEISLKEAKLEVSIHEKGAPVSEGILPADSRAAKTLDTLMKAGSWMPSLVTYAPSTFLNTDDYKINVAGNAIVVNFKDKRGRWSQVVREIDAADAEELTRSVRAELQPKPDPMRTRTDP